MAGSSMSPGKNQTGGSRPPGGGPIVPNVHPIDNT